MREFDPALVTVEHGPRAIAVIKALAVFAQGQRGSELVQHVPLVEKAIAAGETKPIARAILATLRAVHTGRARVWDAYMREYWEAAADTAACIAGIDASRVFLIDRERALYLETDELREALVKGDAFAIRTARMWADHNRFKIERTIVSVWGDSHPADPDWKVLGDPMPEVRLTSSLRFISDDEIAAGIKKS